MDATYWQRLVEEQFARREAQARAEHSAALAAEGHDPLLVRLHDLSLEVALLRLDLDKLRLRAQGPVPAADTMPEPDGSAAQWMVQAELLPAADD